MSVIPRLNRLFGPDGNCFDVAIDHGFFNEGSFLGGIEQMPNVVATVVKANPDAIQLSPGTMRHLQDLPGKGKPALVLRTDVANVYGKELPRFLFSQLIDAPLELALRADAACVVAEQHGWWLYGGRRYRQDRPAGAAGGGAGRGRDQGRPYR